MSLGIQNGISVSIPNADNKLINKIWKKYTDDYGKLNKNKKAKQVFDNFAYSHRKEYLQWITEAKTEETRNKRMATALEWIAEGKGRNWKYERK